MDIHVAYDLEANTDLCAAMEAVGSEIAGPHHNYTKLYSPIMEPVRNEPLRLFHFGMRPSYDASGAVQTPAASLQGWRAYFPNATICGGDDLSANIVDLPNIHTFQYSLADPSGLEKLWGLDALVDEFDIMIDNGINHPHANVYCFENSAHKLKVGGVYIIENIFWKTSTYWVNKRVTWEKRFNNFTFRFLSIPHPTNKDTNIVILAQKKSAEAKPENEITSTYMPLEDYINTQMAKSRAHKGAVKEISTTGNQVVE